MKLWIADHVPDVFRLILLVEGAHRAVYDALAAVDAAHFGELHLPRGLYGRLKATVNRADDADMLYLLTDGDATAAQDALVVVAYDRGRQIVHKILILYAGILFLVIHAELTAELLQFAVLAANAGKALLFMSRKRQLQDVAAEFTNLRRIGFDDHAVACRQYAGSLQGTSAGIDDAHTARADLIDIL